MYTTSSSPTPSKTSSLESGFESISFEVESVNVLDKTRTLLQEIKIFNNKRKPTITEKQELYDSLLEFSAFFNGGPILHSLIVLNHATLSASSLQNITKLLSDFIANPHHLMFKLKEEFYCQVLDEKILQYPPLVMEMPTINAQILEKLLVAYFLNVAKMESCAPRDWAKPDTTFIGAADGSSKVKLHEFVASYPGSQKALDPTEGKNIRLKTATALLAIVRYCKNFGLNEQQINFVLAHVNQNGALGSIISALGGRLFEKWYRNPSFTKFGLPAQTNIVFNIITKPGNVLCVQAITDLVLRKLDGISETLPISKLMLEVEIPNNWRPLVHAGRSFMIPTSARIKFSYTEPKLPSLPGIQQLLDRVWPCSRSSSSFATIEKIRA
jgi:hypothetical protein